MGSNGLQLGEPLSEEEVAALIRARLAAADDDPVLPQSEIRGQVVDETGLGVRSQVFLKSDPFYFEILMETWTDDEGRFTLTGLPAGRFLAWTIEPGEARAALSLVHVQERRARAVKLVLRPRCPAPAGLGENKAGEDEAPRP